MYPAHQSTPDSLSQVYHSHLKESLKAFQAKTWKPLKENTCSDIPTIIKGPPLRTHSRQNGIMSKSMLVVPAWTPPSRPVSVLSDKARPTSSYRSSDTPDVHPGNFDTLDPETLANLIGPERPTSVYGERCHLNDSDDVSSTSGIDSDWSILDDDDDDDEPDEPNDETRVRPEAMDSMYVPEDRLERKRYDFDASNTEIPKYEFKNILPKGSRYLDFAVIAKQDLDWRNLTELPQSQQMHKLFDRLIDLEKLQNETIQNEVRRMRPPSRRLPFSRLTTRFNDKSRDKRCCSTCLQIACVGDCPEKVSPKCALCRQPLCGGSCSSTYDQRMRHLTVDESANGFQQKPQFCSPCRRKHNAKYINANNTLLGRPRSSNTTFSRGRSSAKPKDLRPKSAVELSSDMFHQFEILGIDPSSRPSTAMSSRPRSRNGLLPGKSFSSNRKASISDAKYKARKTTR